MSRRPNSTRLSEKLVRVGKACETAEGNHRLSKNPAAAMDVSDEII